MVDQFYSVVTDFYEYGWGDSFHFGQTFPNESYTESIRRHEYYLALRMKIGPGAKLVDMVWTLMRCSFKVLPPSCRVVELVDQRAISPVFLERT